jgi:hypothetical protein
MRSPRKPSHSHIKPGMLVKPKDTVRAIRANDIHMSFWKDERYYFWQNDVGLIVRKLKMKHSVMDSLYPDIHVLIGDLIIITTTDQVVPL